MHHRTGQRMAVASNTRHTNQIHPTGQEACVLGDSPCTIRQLQHSSSMPLKTASATRDDHGPGGKWNRRSHEDHTHPLSTRMQAAQHLSEVNEKVERGQAKVILWDDIKDNPP